MGSLFSNLTVPCFTFISSWGGHPHAFILTTYMVCKFYIFIQTRINACALAGSVNLFCFGKAAIYCCVVFRDRHWIISHLCLLACNDGWAKSTCSLYLWRKMGVIKRVFFFFRLFHADNFCKFFFSPLIFFFRERERVCKHFLVKRKCVLYCNFAFWPVILFFLGNERYFPRGIIVIFHKNPLSQISCSFSPFNVILLRLTLLSTLLFKLRISVISTFPTRSSNPCVFLVRLCFHLQATNN